jgi:hypothetical protein
MTSTFALAFVAIAEIGSGVLYMLLGRPYARGTSPAGDAVSAA